MSYTIQEYVKDALRTESKVSIACSNKTAEPIINCLQLGRLLHSAMGFCTESGEFLDALKKHIFYGKPLDVVNLKEELGDLLWYFAIACDAFGVDPSDIMQTNINKLHTRYPEKFNNEQAVTRDLQAERKTLETISTETKQEASGVERFYVFGHKSNNSTGVLIVNETTCYGPLVTAADFDRVVAEKDATIAELRESLRLTLANRARYATDLMAAEAKCAELARLPRQPVPERSTNQQGDAMSDNTEPVVTQEDRDAADQLRIYLLRKMDLELEDDVIGEFEKHFAAHRTAAVAKREKEIVRWLKCRADRLRIMASDDMAAGHPRYTAKHSSQARIIDELVKEIQNGGGA